MAAFHPRVEDLPGEFPVFPLPGAVVLPRGKLPLRIFEPRYRTLIEDVLERDYFMTAEMAKDFGLVDKVIDKRPELPPPVREG